MYTFFVLGLIPGTSIQITFLIWTDIILVGIELVSIVWLLRRHPIHVKFVSYVVYTLVTSMGTMHDLLRLALKHSSIAPVQEDEVSA